MTFPFPHQRIDQQDWEVERHQLQRNQDALSLAFPLAANSTIFGVVPQARVYNSVALPWATGVVAAVTYDSERWDLGTTTEQHSVAANQSRLTCQVPGLYSIKASIEFAAVAGGDREVSIRLNGVTNLASQKVLGVPAAQCFLTVATDYRLVVGDYVEATLFQNSGGPINTTNVPNRAPEFMWHWVSP